MILQGVDWRTTQNYQSFELRSHRFRDEMLPVFYKWLGINETSKVLDGGCGSGVFTRYLAKGLTTGHITGFDINETFIEFGKEKIKNLGLSEKAKLEFADGYRLHYSDNHFDAVTNYTYTGVLSDKKAGLNELIRVCKQSGVVSCVIATNAITRIGYEGNYPFDGAERLRQLAEKEWRVFSNIQKMNEAKQPSELALFKTCGLSEIHIYPFSHLICYNDAYFPEEYRKAVALDEITEEKNWLKSRYVMNEKVYTEQGFYRDDFYALTELLEKKLAYLAKNFETDKSYEWHGGFNFIITGKKQKV
jgi:ubiquinone/menaquinone biosynthesis C-methylase UbiE